MIGDTIVGIIAMLVLFASCILLFEPEVLGSKFTHGGLPMFVMGIVVCPFGGASIGRSIRKETEDEKYQRPSPRRESGCNPFEYK